MFLAPSLLFRGQRRNRPNYVMCSLKGLFLVGLFPKVVQVFALLDKHYRGNSSPVVGLLEHMMLTVHPDF